MCAMVHVWRLDDNLPGLVTAPSLSLASTKAGLLLCALKMLSNTELEDSDTDALVGGHIQMNKVAGMPHTDD